MLVIKLQAMGYDPTRDFVGPTVLIMATAIVALEAFPETDGVPEHCIVHLMGGTTIDVRQTLDEVWDTILRAAGQGAGAPHPSAGRVVVPPPGTKVPR